MRSNEFVRRVAGHARFSSTTEARDATRATLGTLAEVVSEETAGRLAADLPYDLEAWVAAAMDESGPAEAPGPDEFVQRVCRRLPGRVGGEDAEQQANLVMRTLRETVAPDAWQRLVDELPEDLEGALLR